MARKFEFRDNYLKLDIAGNVFEVDVTNPETMETITKFADEALKKSEELKKEQHYTTSLRDGIGLCLRTIDAILGDGASEKIFEGRSVGLLDCLDVINYINTEVARGKEDAFRAYSPNRAQRRAKK